jgi:hypothetical protein
VIGRNSSHDILARVWKRTSGAKAQILINLNGTAKAVPFQGLSLLTNCEHRSSYGLRERSWGAGAMSEWLTAASPSHGGLGVGWQPESSIEARAGEKVSG